MADNRRWAAPAVILVVVVVLVAVAWRWEARRDNGAQEPASQPAVRVRPAASEDGIYVYFTPGGKGTSAIVEQIGQARNLLHIQAYMFTSPPIAEAVVDAHKRGVQIIAVLDPSQQSDPYHAATFLYNAGIPVYIDHQHDSANNKIMLIDGRVVITGSFNFTKSAEESNAENLLILVDKPGLYAAYEKNFQTHLRHSERYQGRPTRPPQEQPTPNRSRRSGRSSRQPAPVRGTQR
jgi:phosphatidylserine/phosphatidylglycerophosphate/cardiolipin synthase-like enzyme